MYTFIYLYIFLYEKFFIGKMQIRFRKAYDAHDALFYPYSSNVKQGLQQGRYYVLFALQTLYTSLVSNY